VTRTRQGLVLLVEDDALSLKLMKDVLEANSYEVAQATNGPDALSMLNREIPDLVVMDIGLPGMDGVEVTRLMKQDSKTARVPVLAVSAYAMPEDEKRMRDTGCDAFITKPLHFAEFVAEIGRLLEKTRNLASTER
jgi:two-component system, cell cycle response regulator DivK